MINYFFIFFISFSYDFYSFFFDVIFSGDFSCDKLFCHKKQMFTLTKETHRLTQSLIIQLKITQVIITVILFNDLFNHQV